MLLLLRVPPQPLACRRSSRLPPSPASPFRRKAPLSAAGRVESARDPGGSANGAGQRFLRSSRQAAEALRAGSSGRRSRRARGASPAGRRGGVSLRLPGRRGPPLALGARGLGRSPAEAPGPLRRASPGRARSRGDDDAATLLTLPGLGRAGREGAAWTGKTRSGPTAPRVCPFRRLQWWGPQETLRDDLVCRWCSERAKVRGSEGAGVCEELLCVWYVF